MSLAEEILALVKREGYQTNVSILDAIDDLVDTIEDENDDMDDEEMILEDDESDEG